MSFFNRLSNGWTIAQNSFKVLKANRQLLIFPVLSGVSMILIMATFFVGALGLSGWNLDQLNVSSDNKLLMYVFLFSYYIVNYFIVVFFNMALIHCTTLYFRGEEVTVAQGIAFSRSRGRNYFCMGCTCGFGWSCFTDHPGKRGNFRKDTHRPGRNRLGSCYVLRNSGNRI